MKFNRISDWAEVSECGLFTVSASVTGKGKDKRYAFQAWKRAPADSHDMAKPLGSFPDAESARERCRKEAR